MIQGNEADWLVYRRAASCVILNVVKDLWMALAAFA
jgi:hypothetical protein